MKKKIISIVMLILVAISCMFVGCFGTQQIQLSAPANLKIVDNILSWDKVDGAVGYVVFLDNREYELTELNFDISFLEEGEYTLEVLALGDDEKYADSDWSKIDHIVPPEEIIIPTEGLEYKLLADGSGYEVSRGKANLEGIIIFPDTYNGLPVKKISEMAFQLAEFPNPDPAYGYPGCNLVTTGVRFPKYLEEIGDRAFGCNLALSDVVIPEGVKIIGDRAFRVTRIEKIEIPESVESIGEAAFAYNSYLTEAKLPESLNNIPEALFYSCSKLENIQWPSKIESVGGYAVFRTKWYSDFPNDYVILGNFLLGYKGNSPTVDKIPQTVTHIADGAFANKTTQDVLHYENCLAERVVIPNFVTLGKDLFYDNDYVKEVVFEEGVTVISESAFSYCSKLEQVTLPESLERIEDSAFYCAHSITKIALPADLSYIGRNAFASCIQLKEIVWPENLTEISDGAFSGCALEKLELPQSVTKIGEGAFSGNDFESVYLPSGVTHIGDKAFSNCKQMTSITIPSGVTYIGEGVFVKCSVLDNVVFPEGIKEVKARTFKECKALKKVYLPESVQTIGDNAFEDCVALENLSLPINLQTIGAYAFSDCEKLILDLPESVKTLGVSAFKGCKALQEMDLSAVENIEKSVFFSCSSLKSVVLPENMTAIPNGFFQGCSNLTEIVLPATVTDIENFAFNGTALERVYYKGSQAEFDSITVNLHNDPFMNASLYVYSEKEPALNTDGTAYNGNYWHYAEDGKTSVVWKKENIE